jgi:hypothetical protein
MASADRKADGKAGEQSAADPQYRRSPFGRSFAQEYWESVLREPIDASPTIDQAVNGGFPWLEISSARCKTPSDVDLAAMKHPPTTFVHDPAGRLRCRKCAKAGWCPSATLLQLARQSHHPRTEA